ncbi:MAG: hypothetical protein ACLVJO_07615 [[Clostridium] scindens]
MWERSSGEPDIWEIPERPKSWASPYKGSLVIYYRLGSEKIRNAALY